MTELFREVPDADRYLALGLWTRRLVMTLFATIAVLGLLSVFGQRESTSSATTGRATLKVTAPSRVRGGLYFQSTLVARSTHRIGHPEFVLDHGWVEGMQVNSIEPAPMEESERDGGVVLSYDALDAGDTLRVWLQFQVDPTSPGHRSYGVAFSDGTVPLVQVRRELTVFP